MRGFSLQRPAGMLLLAALIYGLSVCASTASAISSSYQASVSPARNGTPFTPSADPTAPDASDGDSAVQDQNGGPEFCHLRSHIVQQPGRIMDAVGWFGDCFPDTSPLVYTLTAACVVETAGSWNQVSCTSIRSQYGNPPIYSYHAGWHCTVGIYYRARAYGVFSRFGAPLWSNPANPISGPKLCT
jgi:hypothetical protein